jgi:protein gp37
VNWTSIQWTWRVDPKTGELIPNSGSTWNPLVGCRRISPACGIPGGPSCYAERLIAVRMSKNPNLPMYHDIARVTDNGEPQFTGEHRLLLDRLDEPFRTKKPRPIFVADMGDLFFEGHSNSEIAAVFGVMAAAHWQRFMVLTKRTKRMREWFEWVASFENDHGPPPTFVCETEAVNFGADIDRLEPPWPLKNVWLGTTTEDRKRFDERVPHLRACPAPVHFLSVEPQLEDLGDVDLRGIDWVIQGGWSGPKADVFDLAWARSLRDRCKASSTAYFLKQLGANPHQSSAHAERFGSIENLKDSHGGNIEEFPIGLADTISRYLIRRIEETHNITLHPHTELVSLDGDDRLRSVTWRGPKGMETHPLAHVFLMIGAEPNSTWLGDCVALDDKGFVKTGAELTTDDLVRTRWPVTRPPFLFETNRHRVFAVGDVRSGSVKRVASAVGEGSVCVQLVHRALTE